MYIMYLNVFKMMVPKKVNPNNKKSGNFCASR